jgi:NAD(P)-dependent dehydrogenase (short-subunit alcohol dehydrogenase family)
MAENSNHKAGMVVDSGQGPHLLLPRAKTAFDHFDEGFNPCSQLSFGKIPGGGAIVNISSIGAIRHLGYPCVSYCASKGAINQLTQNVAIQYAEKGIRANCVLPGLMNTPMIVEPLKHSYAQGDIEQMIKIRDALCPMKKMGDAWDVAYASLFLASDEAKYITGIQLVVDGGITCKFA